ncbi:MAG: thioredoxin family protein, partial [Zetaproteobacteria bacterium]|nr:thioredoxin family protein [Zetaproteobacteria bacterium]
LGLYCLGGFTSLSKAAPSVDLFTEPAQATQENIHPKDVVSWQTYPAQLIDQNTLELRVTLQTTRGFGLYADRVHFEADWGLLLEHITPPTSTLKQDPISQKKVPIYNEGDFILQFAIPSASTAATLESVRLSVNYTSCSEGICLFPYTETLPTPVLASGKELFPAKEQATSIQTLADNILNTFEAEQHAQTVSLWLFITIALAGLLTNLTPCVFPMIPITVRLLSRGSQNHWLAGVAYATGILLTYSSLALFAVLSGGMFAQFMANFYVQVTLALIMFALGLSMISGTGFERMQKFGYDLGNHSTGYGRILLMGLGAGFIASPCTGPVLASLLTFAASSSNSNLAMLLIVTYSLGFALPYILLGAVSKQLSSIQIGRTAQVGTKFLFASAMFGLCFYYLRVPLLKFHQDLVPSYPYLAIGTMICGMALFAIRPQHSGYQLAGAIPLGFAFFAGSQVMFPAHHPASAPRTSQVHWHHNEEEAFHAATKNQTPLLIDLWAEWCEACKEMDRTTFVDPEVLKTLDSGRWTLLRLDMTTSTEYTDSLQERFQVVGLPTLILMQNSERPEVFHKVAGYSSAERLLEELRSIERAISTNQN